MEETDLILLVFCHAADAGVVVGGLVVRQTPSNIGPVYKPVVSANIQPVRSVLKGKVNWGKKSILLFEFV